MTPPEARMAMGQELLRLAARLRRAVRRGGEGTDIGTCLEIAGALDQLATFRTPVEQELRIAHIRAALALESRGAALLLARLLDRPGLVHSHAELERALCCARASIKVFACHLRAGLRPFDAEHALRSVWGVGYYIMPSDMPRLIADLGLPFPGAPGDACFRENP